MSIKHVLLGSLFKEPKTGFDLKKVLDGSVSHFWSAELSQIYPTLKKMQDEGLVTCEAQARNKIYHITDAGRSELLRWIKTPMGISQQREAFMVKIYFGACLTNGELLRVIDEQKGLHNQTLAEFEAALKTADSIAGVLEPEAAREFRIQLLTLRAGIQYHKFWAAWCDDAVGELKRLPDLPGQAT